ncbi:MAG: Cna B-type domain-containing protein [Ruminococcaceae bacterium]|nr:Cna B-type domain-containing protein [Oscillospiraceae bacterium]
MDAFKSNKLQLNIRNILFYTVCTLFCVASCVFLFFLSVTHAVALEQEIRCGIEEHTHTDSCYNGDFLTCDKTAHTHDGNCYIVLLKENDINEILTLIGDNDDHSLENVITDTMSTALTFNSNINSPNSDTNNEVPLTRDTVEELNNTISDEENLPDIVLNENINSVQMLAVGNQNQNTAQTFAVDIGGKPATSGMVANVYVYIDGAWKFIGTTDITRSGSGSNYSVHVATDGLLSLVNEALDTDYTYQSFDISASRYQSSSFTKYTLDDQSTTIATRQSNSNSSKVRYIRLVPKGTNSATSTAFNFYTVSYYYPDGSSNQKILRAGSEVTIPEGNYQWSDGRNTYTAGDTVTVNSKTTLTATPFYTVTYQYLNGTVREEVVLSGTSIRLPSGNADWQGNGNIYEAGASVVISKDTVFMEMPPYIRVNYNVAFPDVNGVTVSTKPTVAGLSVTTVSDGFAEGISAVIRNVSQQSVSGKVSNNSTGLSRVIQFRGWRIQNTDIILQPNTTLVWDELMQYATDSTINLTAIWEYNALQTASFFIRFDSVAVDTEGNITGQDSNKYTKEIFAAYVGGVDTSLGTGTLQNRYGIADTTADNSYGADQKIRALYGERTDGVWLSAFPSDEFVFSSLVQYANTGYLSVDGVPVKAEDLNDREYAIRWYVFKSQDDAWHIDGKLVKKEGLIHVYKTFAGNKELITEAKSDFYIDATDVSTGVNTVLNLSNATSYNSATDTYMWEITNVDYGELWTITEHPHLFSDPSVEFSVYSEYTVVDAHENQSITGSGTSLTVRGMTYALDEGTDEVLRAEFTNIYNKSNSIIIKKQDALTGVSIGGATFRLVQNGKPLKFSYDSQSDRYIYDEQNGTHTVLSGTANGYFEISIQNFSYDFGNIIVEEVKAPTGYSPIGNIEIGYIDDDKTIGIIGGNSQMIKYVNGILIVGNSTDSMSVTAKKLWDCPENEWQPVTLQLLANGKLVTTVIAGVQPQVVLSADNNWQHTWSNLPVYVNGVKIEWSIKETVIGTEHTKADGSFVNWLASYGIPIQSTDENGNPHVTLTVTNTTKRVMLRLTKTNMNKSLQLQGATFLLEAVDANGNVISSEIAKNATTGENGTLIFDNLKCDIRYRLTEQQSPEGYLELSEYIYFTIHESGAVTVEESYYAQASGTAYNILVRNAEAIPLPESGGIGIDMFYAFGLMLIVLSFCIYIYYLCKRRCQN